MASCARQTQPQNPDKVPAAQTATGIVRADDGRKHAEPCDPFGPELGGRRFRSLIRTLGMLRRVMEPYFARHGISGSQWGMLRTIQRAQDEGLSAGVRLTDLSDRLLVRPPSVTGAVDRLERMGLVAREASHTDQRAKLVRLTELGRELVRRVSQGHATRVREVLSGLTGAQQRELDRLLAPAGRSHGTNGRRARANCRRGTNLAGRGIT